MASFVKGLDSWLNWVKQQEHKVQEEINTLVNETAHRIERKAKQLAPVDTGNLRRNIVVEDGPTEFSKKVSSKADYSLYVEFGTRKMAAQPFMSPAIFSEQGKYYEKLARIIKKAGE